MTKALTNIVDQFDERDGADYGDNESLHDSHDDDTGNDGDAGNDDDSSRSTSGARNADDALVVESRRQAPQTETTPKIKQGEQAPVDDANLTKLPNGILQDAQGNLIHPQTKEVIARAGKERRLFERASRQESFIAKQDRTIKDMQRQLQESASVHESVKTLGLSNDDLKVGLPIISEFIKNPVEAAKKILEMVAGMGHNLSEVIGGQDNIDMRAVSRLLDDRLKPLTDIQKEREQSVRQTEEQARAEEAVESFFDGHEHSRVHSNEINDLLGRRWQNGDESFTPEKAYYELRLFAAQHGLDFSKPLKPQIEAAQGASQENNQPQTREQRSFPQGRSSGNTQTQRAIEEPESFEANSSWEDIIRSSLKRQ